MKRIYFYLASFIFLCFSCTEKELLPISGSSGKPEKIEILAVDTVSGGVTVNYKIPPTNDIIEIKAVYTLTNGEVRESSSSFYTSFITIDGYNDTDEHEALIYTINRAREMSEPVSVKFHPGESPLNKTIKSMEIIGDFGGVCFQWRNPDKRMLFFEFYLENEQGEMVTMNIISSKLDSTNIAFRGYDTIPYKFAVNISDNFGNSSGMIYPEGGYIIPLWEVKLDKTIQKVLYLEGDVTWAYWGKTGMETLDDDINTNNHTNNYVMPNASLTFDLGKKAKLSRFVIHIPPGVGYSAGCLSIFEMYSTDDDSDSPNGDWKTWTLRNSCTIVKPSGASGSTATEEDKLALQDGWEFSFPLDMPPVRYLRLKALANWGNANYAYFSEMTTYGVYVK
jgi:hypothetical protein